LDRGRNEGAGVGFKLKPHLPKQGEKKVKIFKKKKKRKKIQECGK
jgi:hypothetical protein